MRKLLCTTLILSVALTCFNFTLAADNTKCEELAFDTPFIVRLLLTDENKIINVDIEEYLVGVLASEMSPNAPFEALKAMAVAARTYTLYMMKINKNKDYDITSHSSSHQAYKVIDEGSKSTYEVMKNAVEATKNEVVYYDNSYALTLYHASSMGKTESCKNVFIENLPYLISVETPFEDRDNAYFKEVSLSVDEINSILKSNKLPTLLKESLEIRVVYNESDRCSSLILVDEKNGVYISGKDVRKMFNLRSTAFDVNIKDDCVEFITYGYGHGVGLSQNGACIMADSGKNYIEILSLYYQGCQVLKTIYKS